MNKKSRIKTTLDSLFTSGKISPEETTSGVENSEAPTKQTRAVKKIEKPKEETPAPPVPASKPEPAAAEILPVSPKPLLEQPVPVKQVIEAPGEQAEKPKAEILATQPGEKHMDTPEQKPVQFQPQPVETKPQTQMVDKNKVDEDEALRVAREIDQASKSQAGDEEHLVIFTLGKELYGVTIHSVESIIKLQAITIVPRTASYILGVTNLRGTVVPVLDLRKRFNLPTCENTPNTRIVIINAEGSKVGIVVDEVTEVLKVSRGSIQPPPSLSTTVESAFINGIARINNRLVILLDLEKVLASSSRQFNR
jgi:purine-binding chemotaxis protein CheW